MILEIPDVTIVTGRARSSLYRDMANGSFPAPDYKGGPRAIGWSPAAIIRWCEQRGVPVTVRDLIAVRVARVEAERRARLEQARKRKAAKRNSKRQRTTRGK